jgi:hypothetical protein
MFLPVEAGETLVPNSSEINRGGEPGRLGTMPFEIRSPQMKKGKTARSRPLCAQPLRPGESYRLKYDDVLSLRAFLAFGDRELHLLAFGQ